MPRDPKWQALKAELRRWLRDGYTRTETPLDDYGREVVCKVIGEMDRLARQAKKGSRKP